MVVQIYKYTSGNSLTKFKACLTLGCYSQPDVSVKVSAYGKSEEQAVLGLREAILEINICAADINFSNRRYITNDIH